MINQWQHVGTSVTGIGYAYHVLRRHDGADIRPQWGVLLCLGSGPILGRGAMERIQAVNTYDEAERIGDEFCRAMRRGRYAMEAADQLAPRV